jgi:hypothetical protein
MKTLILVKRHDVWTNRGEVYSSPRWWDDREDLFRHVEDDIRKDFSVRYYIAPDTEYDSNLYHVFDSQERNQFGEQKCVLTFAPKAIAKLERDRLNSQPKQDDDPNDFNALCAEMREAGIAITVERMCQYMKQHHKSMWETLDYPYGACVAYLEDLR